MGAGKPLAIVSGILTLAAVFALNWIEGSIVYGINAAMNLMTMFTDAAGYATTLGLESSMSWMSYIVGVLVVLFLLSGIFLLIGAKKRALAIIGGLFPLLAGLIILLDGFEVLTALTDMGIDLSGYIATIFGGTTELVPGTIPFSLAIPLGSFNLELGAILLLVGGLLGFISGLMGRDDYY